MEEAFNSLLSAIAVAVVAYAANLLREFVQTNKAKVGELVGEAARDRLEKAIENGIALAEDAAGNVDLATAAAYVRRMNPGDLALKDLAGDKLLTRIRAATAQRASWRLAAERPAVVMPDKPVPPAS